MNASDDVMELYNITMKKIGEKFHFNPITKETLKKFNPKPKDIEKALAEVYAIGTIAATELPKAMANEITKYSFKTRIIYSKLCGVGINNNQYDPRIITPECIMYAANHTFLLGGIDYFKLKKP